MSIRKPAFAGQFYPDTCQELDALLDEVYSMEKHRIDTQLAQERIIGGIAPHAGYMFSSYQAVHLFEIVKAHPGPFETFFIINPNHSGLGNDYAYDSNDYWDTPCGKVEVDRDFAQQLNIPLSDKEQKREHSGEVMVPMLKHFLHYDFKIAPITLTVQSLQNAKSLARLIFEANQVLKKRIFVIASSDFSHFVSPQTGREKDQMVIEKIQEFDAEGVEQIIAEKQVSVCGYGPIMTLMEYARLRSGKPKASILSRGSSGDVMPSSEVVDYVSVLFYETG